MVSFIGGLAELQSAPAFGLLARGVPISPRVQVAVVWWIAIALIAALLCLLQQADARRFTGRLRAGEQVVRLIRKRLPAVWKTERVVRVVQPPRRGAGGAIGRVPPRPAAGSTLPLRLVLPVRTRSR